MNRICHIVGAGDFSPALIKIQKGDLLIAADAGYRHLTESGIQPDLYIGDSDSLRFSPKGIESVILPVEKDDTDLAAAIKEGLKRSFRSFRLYGALGGKRFSHSLANLQLLSFLSRQGGEGVIVDENCTVRCLPVGEYSVFLPQGYFSVFAAEGEARLTISGAHYPLENALLTPYFPLGVSNQGTENTCIKVLSGAVFLIEEP